MWTFINQASNAVAGVWFWPLQNLSPTLQVCITAVPVTVFALLVFRWASNQDGIHMVKDRIKAYLLELWLYKDDLRILLRAQRQVIKYSLLYLRYALVPMAIMIVPVALVIVQLESRFAFQGLVPGESTILAVTIEQSPPISQLDVSLSLPSGIIQETPPLRIDDADQVLWRIQASGPGRYTVGINIGDTTFARTVVVGAENQPASPVVYRDGDWRTLGYPAEPALASDARVSAIELSYPRARAEFAGLSSASWILFGATLVLGFALRGVFDVTF